MESVTANDLYFNTYNKGKTTRLVEEWTNKIFKAPSVYKDIIKNTKQRAKCCIKLRGGNNKPGRRIDYHRNAITALVKNSLGMKKIRANVASKYGH